jgi:hypothetical protein
MKKSTRRLIGGLAVAAGAVGAAGAYLKRKRMAAQTTRNQAGDVWARPGMLVTFRAELMPGRDRQDRTFRIKELLPSGRVSLDGVDGEHAQKEFEPLQIKRRAS